MNYEAMYIIQPNLEEEARKSLITEINGIFAAEKEVKEWGMRELAYEINYYKNGYYVLVNMPATPEEVSEFERVCRIKEDIIRFMIVRDEK